MKSICLILLLALSTLPACSHSKSTSLQSRGYAKYIKASQGNRGQSRAYAKYIKKSRDERAKRMAQLAKQKAKLPSPDTMVPSEPVEKTQFSEGPQAVPSDQVGE